METHLQELYRGIIYDITNNVNRYTQSEFTPCSAGLHKLVQKIKGQSSVTLNFNEEGKLHSKYLGDRYEPAVIVRYCSYSVYYYLFDGEIKDCVHPFLVEIGNITYHSSERIERELPIYIEETEFYVVEIYNGFELYPLIKGYKHGRVEIKIADYPKRDYTLHDCMEPAMQFKFAD